VVEYEYDATRKLLIATLSGIVRGEEFHRGFPDIREGTLELVDMSAVTGNHLPWDELHRLAVIDRTSPLRVSRMALLAPNDVGFGLSRIYQSLMDGSDTAVWVFRDRKQALAWLGVEEARGAATG